MLGLAAGFEIVERENETIAMQARAGFGDGGIDGDGFEEFDDQSVAGEIQVQIAFDEFGVEVKKGALAAKHALEAHREERVGNNLLRGDGGVESVVTVLITGRSKQQFVPVNFAPPIKNRLSREKRIHLYRF